MKRSFLETVNQHLKFQRNCFWALSFLLAICSICLSIFLFLKSERVVVLPQTVEKEFWVDKKSVSPSYLEQYGYFLSQLLLGKSPSSAPRQREILLRHSAPEYSGFLRNKLIDEETALAKQSASYTFFPVAVHANPETRQVLIEGDRVFYVSGKQVSSEREGYILSFRYAGGRLLLTGVQSNEKTNQ